MAERARKHITGKGYLLTFVALVVLATISLGLALLQFTGDLVLSLVIAGIKAWLVLWFFMHLAEQRFANRLVVLVSLLLIGLLISLTVVDVVTRHTFPKAPEPTQNNRFYLPSAREPAARHGAAGAAPSNPPE